MIKSTILSIHYISISLPSTQQSSSQQPQSSSRTADNKLLVVRDSTTYLTNPNSSNPSKVPVSRNTTQHPIPMVKTPKIPPSSKLQSKNKTRINNSTSSSSSSSTLHTNRIPTISGYSKNNSVLLSIDSDTTKEILLTNLQQLIQDLLQQKADTAQIVTSVTTCITNLSLPIIGFSNIDQPSSFEFRYNATNPTNGAC